MRFSTHSKASEAPTYKTDVSDAPSYASTSTDSVIRDYERSIGRMEDRRIQDQRYERSQEKIDEMDKLAVIGKVEKSLQRRMHNQDATMRPKEKQPVENTPLYGSKKVSEKK